MGVAFVVAVLLLVATGVLAALRPADVRVASGAAALFAALIAAYIASPVSPTRWLKGPIRGHPGIEWAVGAHIRAQTTHWSTPARRVGLFARQRPAGAVRRSAVRRGACCGAIARAAVRWSAAPAPQRRHHVYAPIESHAAADRMNSVPTRTAKAIAFHDHMRALWEAHGSWTHMVIVSFVGNLPNLAAEERVLLHNQADIGNAVKPYYGAAAAEKLSALLKKHILGAVEVLEAAKSGSQSKLTSAEAAWFKNGRQIAGFLHHADPKFLSLPAARKMMRIHLNQVIQQAVDELQGKYLADAHAFAPYIRHLLDMADMISGGIIQQFPARFR
jgi:hypothetical protein